MYFFIEIRFFRSSRKGEGSLTNLGLLQELSRGDSTSFVKWGLQAVSASAVQPVCVERLGAATRFSFTFSFLKDQRPGDFTTAL